MKKDYKTIWSIQHFANNQFKQLNTEATNLRKSYSLLVVFTKTKFDFKPNNSSFSNHTLMYAYFGVKLDEWGGLKIPDLNDGVEVPEM